MKSKKLIIIPFLVIVIIIIVFLNFSKTKSNKISEVEFSNENEIAEEVSPYTDKYANEKINITQSYNLNQEFKVKYKTFEPDGEGNAEFRAKSMKIVDNIDQREPEEGKKLVLVEIAIKGNSKNKGKPSTFNQIGDFPSPQFVLIDKNNNKSYVEETYYSDVYTQTQKLFELSKITLDSDKWVDTALVFQIDENIEPDLTLRFTNLENKAEFYDIKQ